MIFRGWKSAALAGWVWSLGWSLFAFRFLREIDPAVPFLLAPVVSLWAAVFAQAAEAPAGAVEDIPDTMPLFGNEDGD